MSEPAASTRSNLQLLPGTDVAAPASARRASPVEPGRGPWSGPTSVLSLAATALLAYAIAIVFATPRFVLWKGLYIPPAQKPPEVSRAVVAVAQLAHPFAPITDSNHVVLQWRLLFPLIGHVLHLPDKLYLAIPQVGCLVTLMYVAHLGRRWGMPGVQVLLATTLSATTSWFIISNAWLSYEDAWFVLGLLVVTFERSWAVMMLACVLTPFVDERFVLAMPVALATRWAAAPPDRLAQRRSATAALVVGGALLPYLLLRLIVFSHDPASHAFLARRSREMHEHYDWTQYLLGPWMGLRLLWLGVIVAVGRPARAKRWPVVIGLGGALLLTTAVSLVVAADLSRSIAMLLPAAMLGLFWLVTADPARGSWLLAGLTVGNLLLPVSNVVTGFNEKVHTLTWAINDYQNPPPEVDANFYTAAAEAALEQPNPPAAVQILNWAVRLSPDSARALSLRSTTECEQGNWQAASLDATRAMRISPSEPDALLTLGRLDARAGVAAEADALYRRALASGGDAWPRRRMCERLRDGLFLPSSKPTSRP